MLIGLKLWSVNTGAHLREAMRLYAEKVFDYLELYVVPDTLESLAAWKGLQNEIGLPFVIHAPHSAHGVNLSDPDRQSFNARIFDEVRHFADALDAAHIIVHGGFYPIDVSGSSFLVSRSSDSQTETRNPKLETLISQLRGLNDDRLLLENKPFLPVGGAPIRLVGSTPGEIRRVLTAVGCGFCLDVGHAVSSANAHEANWRTWLAEFLDLQPTLFHLSDLQVDSTVDQHFHFGAGTLPAAEVVSRLPPDAMVSIETVKDSKDNLNDFRHDAERLRSMMRY